MRDNTQETQQQKRAWDCRVLLVTLPHQWGYLNKEIKCVLKPSVNQPVNAWSCASWKDCFFSAGADCLQTNLLNEVNWPKPNLAIFFPFHSFLLLSPLLSFLFTRRLKLYVREYHLDPHNLHRYSPFCWESINFRVLEFLFISGRCGCLKFWYCWDAEEILFLCESSGAQLC